MSILGELWVKLGLKNEEFKKGIDESTGKTRTFGESVKKISTAAKVAWAAVGTAALKLVKDMAQAAADAQGIVNQFKNIADVGTLDALRKATRGAVSDVELMKTAIKAANFNIPIKNLATYFEFATNRAIQTGESVDYLVDSIITGLGRESAMILDNLGISASAIKEEMEAGASMADALGTIIQTELGKSGEVANTSAINIARVSAAWDNLKVTMGNSQVIQSALLAITNGLNSLVKGIDEVVKKGGIAAHNRFVEIDEDVNFLKAMGKSSEEILDILNDRLQDLKYDLGINWLDGFFKNGFKNKEIKNQISALTDYIAKFKEVEQVVTSSPLNTTTPGQVVTKKVAQMLDINYTGVKMKLPKDNINDDKLAEELFAIDDVDFFGEDNPALKALDEFNAKYQKAVEQTQQISDMFAAAITTSIVDSIGLLVESLAAGEEINAGSMVAAILTPLADMAISAGSLVLSTGVAVEGIKDALMSLNPYVAIAAGAALVALGTAAKAGLSAIAKNGGGNKGSSYSFSGGGYGELGGYGTDMSYENQSVEVTGVLRGQDIYLASEKYKNSKKR